MKMSLFDYIRYMVADAILAGADDALEILGGEDAESHAEAGANLTARLARFRVKQLEVTVYADQDEEPEDGPSGPGGEQTNGCGPSTVPAPRKRGRPRKDEVR